MMVVMGGMMVIGIMGMKGLMEILVVGRGDDDGNDGD